MLCFAQLFQNKSTFHLQQSAKSDPSALLFSPQEVQIGKEVAPKAEEEGAESSSSETNGPVAAAAATARSAATQEGGAETGRL